MVLELASEMIPVRIWLFSCTLSHFSIGEWLTWELDLIARYSFVTISKRQISCPHLLRWIAEAEQRKSLV